MPSSGARRRMRPNRRDRERTRNFSQRIENNRELVKSTGDSYDDTMKLTISLVNRLSLSANLCRSRSKSKSKISDRKKANFERRRDKMGKAVKAIEPATISITLPVSTSRQKNESNADVSLIKKQPGSSKNVGESKITMDPSEKKLCASRKLHRNNCFQRIVRLMKVARGNVIVCESCEDKGCVRCKLVADS